MRLIDADALESKIIKVRDAVVSHDKYSIGYSNGMSMAHAMSVISPTIDAVPVVRCKDCKHRPKENRSLYGVIWVEFPEEEICPFNCEDPFYNQMPEDDFFCARGERRGDV